MSDDEALPSGSRVPSLSTNKVAIAGPVNTVLTGGSVGVSDGRSAVGPERIVKAVIGTGRAWCTSARGEKLRTSFCRYIMGREGKNTSDGCEGNDEGRETNHSDLVEDNNLLVESLRRGFAFILRLSTVRWYISKKQTIRPRIQVIPIYREDGSPWTEISPLSAV
jgi:hypothetical protein